MTDTHESNETQKEDDNLTFTESQHGLFLNTYLQPVNLGQEVLDQYFNSIISIAPAESNNLKSLLTDKTN